MATVICPKCGLKVRAEDGECFACGAQLPRLRPKEADYGYDSAPLSDQAPQPAPSQQSAVPAQRVPYSNSGTEIHNDPISASGYDQAHTGNSLPPQTATPEQTAQTTTTTSSDSSTTQTPARPDKLKNSTLSIIALIFAILIFPFGIIIGIVDLCQNDKTHKHGLSIVAIVIGGLITILALAVGGTENNSSVAKEEPKVSDETIDVSVESEPDNATATVETAAEQEKSQESAKTEAQTTEVKEEPTAAIEEISSNGVDANKWPSVAALNMPNEQMLKLYKEYYEKIYGDEFPEDASDDVIEAYEAKAGQEIADKYGITPEDALYVYSYVGENYAKVASNGGEVSKEPELKYGEIVSVVMNGSTAIVSAKITPNLTNRMTIEENYTNVDDLIKNKGYDVFDEIQYYAFSDDVDGNQFKIISFTVPRKTIELSRDDKILGSMLEDYVDDLWI